ncbi:MAG: DUF695 domain-containing protein [Candidatus Ozemobacteraceae bacterium]
MTWKHYQCTIKDNLASVLIDQQFQEHYPLKELPQLFWVGIYCDLASDGAFWNPEETQALDEIEKHLLMLGQSFGNGWMVFLFRIATPGIREYYFYYGDGAEVQKIVPALMNFHPKYRIESGFRLDTDWVEYRKYISFDNSILNHGCPIKN